jgi:hypothetical protein
MVKIQVKEHSCSIGVSGADHVYFIRIGNRDNVLVLIRKTNPSTGSSNFISVWLYCAALNSLISIYGENDLIDMPVVTSSKGIGALFLLTFIQHINITQTALFGELRRSDNGDILASLQRPLSDISLVAIVQNPTTVLIFKGSAGGANLLKNVRIPCILPVNDFFVRDWTESPTSSDDGSEPSIHPNFFVTSDVWNRQSLGNGFPMSTDQPASEDAIAGQTNFAYTRVWRKQSGLTDMNIEIQASYFGAIFGTGTNFSKIGQETVVFPGAYNTGPVVSPGMLWLPSTVASHYCMAVAISTPDDPYDPYLESLYGYAPGSGTTGADSQFLNENNKAQRNMAIIQILPQHIKSPYRIDFYAVVHNPSVLPRNIKLQCETQKNVLSHLSDIRIEVFGKKVEPFRPGKTVILPNVQPGENRWVKLSFKLTKVHRDDSTLLPICFKEIIRNKVINGFVVAAKATTISRAINANMVWHQFALNRMHHLLKGKKVVRRLAIEDKAWGEQSEYEKTYMDFLQSQMVRLQEVVHRLIQIYTADPFDIIKALGNLTKTIVQKEVSSAVVCHTTVLNKIHSFLTMIHLSQGDRADILQNVRWQRYLYGKILKFKGFTFAELICKKSDAFINDYPKTKNKDAAFARLMKESIAYFYETTKILRGDKKLKKLTAIIEGRFSNAVSLQKCHREYLLRLQGDLRKVL